MKFTPKLVHFSVFSAIVASVAVIKGASIGDALIVFAIQIPFLLSQYLKTKTQLATTPEIEKLELDARKKQLEISLDAMQHQYLKDKLRRDREASEGTVNKQFIF